jgi:hypothetical protein
VDLSSTGLNVYGGEMRITNGSRNALFNWTFANQTDATFGPGTKTAEVWYLPNENTSIGDRLNASFIYSSNTTPSNNGQIASKVWPRAMFVLPDLEYDLTGNIANSKFSVAGTTGNAPSLTTGYFGRAMNFSNKGDAAAYKYISIANDANLNIPASFSIELYVYPQDYCTGDSYCALFARQTANSGYCSYCLWFGVGANLSSLAFNTGAGTTETGTPHTGGNLNLNEWAHIILTGDGTTIKIWLNGSFYTLGTETTPNGFTNPLGLGNFGGGVGTWTRAYPGKIDHFSVYNYTMTEPEIRARYEMFRNYTNIVVANTTAAPAPPVTNGNASININGSWSGYPNFETGANVSLYVNTTAGQQICWNSTIYGYGGNYSCNTTFINTSFLIPNFTQTVFYNNSKTITGEISVSHNIRVQVNASMARNYDASYFGLSGDVGLFGRYPNNVFVDLFSDGVTDVLLPGNLSGSTLNQTCFTNLKSSEVLAFGTNGSIRRYLNYSLNGLGGITPGNMTVSVYGQSANSNGTDFTENFQNYNKINVAVSNTSRMFVYDDFNNNISGRWTATDRGADFYDIYGNLGGTGLDQYISKTVIYNGIQTDSEHSTLKMSDLDLATYKGWTANAIFYNYCAAHGTGGDLAAGGTYGWIGIYDESSSTLTQLTNNYPTSCSAQYGSTSSMSAGETRAWIFNVSGNTVYSYSDSNTLYSSVSVDLSHHLKLVAYNNFYWYINSGNSGTYITGISSTNITEVNVTGVRGVYSGNLTYKNGTLQSLQIMNASSYLVSAFLDADVTTPDGVSANFYLSPDNSATWEPAIVGETHVFTASGYNLTWMVNFSNIGGTEFVFPTNAPVIRSLHIVVATGYPQNVTVDVGGDGIIDFNASFLNSTNSPLTFTVNGSVILPFLLNQTGLAGTVPVVFYSGTSGAINYSNLNAWSNVSRIRINTSRLNAYMAGNRSFNITVYGFAGTVSINNLAVSYAEDANYSITAWTPANSSNASLATYYSSFTKRTPNNFTDVPIFIPSSNSSNWVSPFGQTNSKPMWNLTFTNRQRNADLWMTANITQPCVNYTVGTSSNTSLAYMNVSNSTVWKVCSNVQVNSSNNCNVWVWANLKNCNATYLVHNPIRFELRSVCVGCVG